MYTKLLQVLFYKPKKFQIIVETVDRQYGHTAQICSCHTHTHTRAFSFINSLTRFFSMSKCQILSVVTELWCQRLFFINV